MSAKSLLLALSIALSPVTVSAAPPAELPPTPAFNHQDDVNFVGERAERFIRERLLANKGAIPWGGTLRPDARPIYVFVDTECSYCHALHLWFSQHDKKLIERNIQPIIIPVAFLRSSSVGAAMTIVHEGWDGYRRFHENKAAFTPMPLIPENAVYLDVVKQNLALLVAANERLGKRSTGTPWLLWRSVDGRYNTVTGMPAQMMDVIDSMGSEISKK